MDQRPEPTPTDLTHQLPRDAFYQLVHTLRRTLPPVSDAPEDLVRRDNAAIAKVASLLPANADEALLAATYIAAAAHAMDCIRLAREHHRSPELVLKCTAQAAGMMRQARATRTLLLRVQADRQTREKDSAALDRANRTEQGTIGLMAQAMAEAPLAPAAPKPAAATADAAAEADRYALAHRKRAALIRRLGRLPDKIDLGPLSPETVRTIITGTSEVLRSLDKQVTA
jgi:hypothetical protein